MAGAGAVVSSENRQRDLANGPALMVGLCIPRELPAATSSNHNPGRPTADGHLTGGPDQVDPSGEAGTGSDKALGQRQK
jgi:hypothetical protein